MKRFFAAFAFLALLAAPAMAGITIDQVPNRGALIYCQLPDATFKVCQGDSSGNLLASPAFAYGSPVTSTRPANTTTYTANTGWANATSSATYLTFTAVCRANGTFVLPTDLLVTDNANQTLKLTGILWLLDAVPTAINDNATFSIASADLSKIKTFIPFSTSTVVNQGSGSAGSAIDEQTNLGRELKCAAGDTNLYGLVQVTNAYVPIASEVLTFTLRAVGAN